MAHNGRVRARWSVAGALAGVLAVAASGCDFGPRVPGSGPAPVELPDVVGQVGPDGAPVADAALPVEPVGLQLLAVSPPRGSTQGGDSVTLVGTGFVSGMVVRFGEVEAPNVLVASPELAGVTTPPGKSGSVDITVELPDGDRAVLPDGFEYFEPFGIDSVEPASGPVEGGTPVTIHGHGIPPDAWVLLGTRPVIAQQWVDSETVLALTPQAAGAGPVDVKLATRHGLAVLPDGFEYRAALTVDRVVPPVGPAGGGQTVRIEGAGFEDGAEVRIGGATAEVLDRAFDGSWLKVLTPQGTPGPADVEVTSGDEHAVLPNGFFYVDPASLAGPLDALAVVPDHGPVSGFVSVWVAASGLTSPDDTAVHFGEYNAGIAKVNPALGFAEVVLPKAAGPGVVDVSVSSANGADVLPGAFRYDAVPVVTSVEPDHGPAAGGTQVVLHGTGLSAVTAVRIGALDASDLTVIDDATVQVTTPPGSPGFNDVVVEAPGGAFTLPDAFLYEADGLVVFGVDPASGSMAGGQTVHVLGTGFAEDALVFFGDTLAPDVTWVSPGELVATTPPSEQPTTVDVLVRNPGAGEAVLPAAYTYFNPATGFGGTWGDPVEGVLNVSVLDVWTNDGVEGALVVAQTASGETLKGYTDVAGHLTLTGDALVGAQKLTAWHPDYSAASIVDFDAENATILLFPKSPPASGGGGGFPLGDVGRIVGKAVFSEKLLIPPPGSCADSPVPPVDDGQFGPAVGALCSPCEEDADCGPAVWGNTCTTLVDGERVCTTPCEIAEDCPEGFACLAPSLGASPRCMPVVGKVRIRCETTRKDAFSTNPEPGDGAVANLTTGEFDMWSRGGEVAVVCTAEAIGAQGRTTPLAMGAAWPVLVKPGGVTEGVSVPIDVSLDRTVDFTLDYPPSGLEALPAHRLRAMVSFGDYGVLDIARLELPFGADWVTVEHTPVALDHSLDGASWLIVAGAFGADSTWAQWIPPYSVAVLRELPALADRHVYRPVGPGEWAPDDANLGPVADLWGDEATGVLYAAGEDGLVYRDAGSGWAAAATAAQDAWSDLDGRGADDVWVVGQNGTVLHFDGTTFGLAGKVPGAGRAVAVFGEDGVAVGGESGAFAWDGAQWTPLPLPEVFEVHAMAGGPDGSLWVAGSGGKIYRGPGIEGPFVSASLPSAATVEALWADEEGTWAAGSFGSLWHRTAGAGKWTPIATGTTRTVRALWRSASGVLYAAGDRGLVLAVSVDGTVTDLSLPKAGIRFEGVWGQGEQVAAVAGHDAVLIGPLLEVAEPLPPLSDGLLVGNELSWSAPGAPADFTYVRIGEPWWSPLWEIVADGALESIELPDLESLAGWDQIQGNDIYLEITRGRIEGFDIDNFSYVMLYFPLDVWDAWSTRVTYVSAD